MTTTHMNRGRVVTVERDKRGRFTQPRPRLFDPALLPHGKAQAEAFCVVGGPAQVNAWTWIKTLEGQRAARAERRRQAHLDRVAAWGHIQPTEITP